jgi:fatty-acyl-CoA synthase
MWKNSIDMGIQIDYHELETRQRTLSFDDPINIQFTSGTTGSPKGATLSHHNILNNGYIAAKNTTHH